MDSKELIYINTTTIEKNEINNQMLNTKKCVSFIIDKIYLPEYINNNTIPNEGLCVEEELSTISKEDELIVIKYLLEVMRKHDIITEEEYHAVLYKYN